MAEKPEKIDYAKLINCSSAEEVRRFTREWSSSLSDDEHLTRSAIFEMHANVESRLKQILYHHSDMDPAPCQG